MPKNENYQVIAADMTSLIGDLSNLSIYEGVQRIGEFLKSKIEKSTSSIYLFSSNTSTFIRENDVDPNFEEAFIEIDELAAFKELVESELNGDFLCISEARRGSTLVGFVATKSPKKLTTSEKHCARICANALVFLYNRRFSLHLFEKLQDPIDFNSNESSFLQELTKIARTASGMQFGAFRELKKGGLLDCLFIWGEGIRNEIENWDVYDDDFGPFRECISSQSAVAISNVDDLPQSRFSEKVKNLGVKSLVVAPVLVGTEVYGIFTFSQASEYYYSDTEINGFTNIANSIGISFENFRTHHQSVDTVGEHASISTALTTVEVAQAVRHEARDVLDDSFTIIATLLLKSAKISNKTTSADHVNLLEKLDDKLASVGNSLDKIRDASYQKFALERKNVGVLTVWEEAVGQVRGKLNKHNITIHNSSTADQKIECYPDRLRQAFLNLISNSIDAFERTGKKSGRRINLSLERWQEKENKINLVYSDNAGGIDPKNLIIPTELLHDEEMEGITQLIFRQGVSSREGGGWGLWLVRKMIDEHRGSIDLLHYRNSVEFKIALSKQL